MAVLVTGGAGYIGTHTIIELDKVGREVVVVDNFSNSNPMSIARVEEIIGKSIKVYNNDVCDKEALRKIFKAEKIDSVIHFAGLKAVGESCAKPLEYYANNIMSTLSLLEVMREFKCNNLVFSSSATVYGAPKSVPISEDFELSATNPYGRTKLFIEEILRDYFKANPAMNIALLRYFNPVGAHKSGKIGEDPNGIPNNLMPFIAQVAIGRLPQLSVFGDDYITPDGTGIRDYVHVCDLARGHVLAINKLETTCGLVTYNLGTGVGYSVLDMVKAFELASDRKVPYKIVARRPGDIGACYADTALAKREIGFEAQFGLADMCGDGWKWQSSNPNGYKK